MGTPPPAVPAAVGQNRLQDGFVLLGTLLAPATLVGLICSGLGVRDSTSAALALATVVLSAVVVVRVKWRRAVLPLLAVASAGLAVAVAVLWRQAHGNEWTRWRATLERHIARCPTDDDACVAATLAGSSAPRHGASAPERLADDQRAAAIVTTIESVNRLLDRRLGVKGTFLGVGLALPSGETNYVNARLPEYLVPNYRDDQKGDVWTWMLQPIQENFDQTLEQLVMTTAPMQVTQLKRDFGPTRATIHRRLSESGHQVIERVPMLGRISQFSTARYRNRVGREDAARVFFFHLGLAWKMRLQDVARYSGYTILSQREGAPPDDALFIWVFLPTNIEEAVPGAWGEILPRLHDWLVSVPRAGVTNVGSPVVDNTRRQAAAGKRIP